MNNKILRLAELIQEDFPEEMVEAFKAEEPQPLEDLLALTGRAISHHQQRAADLWLQAGKKRTAAERKATAQSQLAAFVFAWLTGDTREYVDSAVEAMESLGRHAEVTMVRSLVR